MNVALSVFYRDADNFKASYEHVFRGPLRPADVIRLQSALNTDLGFIPTAVGLSHALLKEDDANRTSSDTPWHDVTGIQSTDEEAHDERTFRQFVDEAEKTNWDDAAMSWEIENPEPGLHDDF